MPEVAGLLAAYLVRRWRRLTWSATAVIGFLALWYTALWIPAADTPRGLAELGVAHCGEWVVALGFVLMVGMTGHFSVGSALGLLLSRLSRSSRQVN